MTSRRPKTIVGNAAKWALLMPFALAAIAVGAGLSFFAGWEIASFVTDSGDVKVIAGIIAMIMVAGAWMGAVTA